MKIDPLKKALFLFLFTMVSLFSYGQLRRIYFNPEAGLLPHLSGSCVMHFKYHLSLNAGINYEPMQTGYYNLHNSVFGKSSSAIWTNFTGIHVLPGISTDNEKKVDVAFFGGPVFGRYLQKTNFVKYDNTPGSTSDGYHYSYKTENIWKVGAMVRVDVAIQFSKYVGLNLAVGGIMHPSFSTGFFAVGIMVGKVRVKPEPHKTS